MDFIPNLKVTCIYKSENIWSISGSPDFLQRSVSLCGPGGNSTVSATSSGNLSADEAEAAADHNDLMNKLI